MTFPSLTNIEFVGAVDKDGNPATLWLEHNNLKEFQPFLIVIQSGTNVAIRNIVLDMDPYYYSAGKVLGVKNDEVTIEVLQGHPRVDGQRAFIMGLYDLAARKAKAVRLTWDANLPKWSAIGSESNRMMRMQYGPLARNCATGDGVFWFQGNWCWALVRFEHIDGLLLENVKVLNGHGFPITCDFCKDITYRKVQIVPEGNRIATVCRDGFKIYCASGKVLMDRIRIEGCLGDDGQNIHGMWMAVEEKRSEKTLMASNPNFGAFPRLTPGKRVRLLDSGFRPAWVSSVKSCVSLDPRRMSIEFEDKIPDWVGPKTPVEPQEWLPDSYIVRDSVFRSAGRYGIYLKSSNTLIERSLFENNVTAIRIGGEWSWEPGWLESGNSQNVEIRECTFSANRLNIAYGGAKSDVAIDVIGCANTPGLMKNFRIHHNRFEDEGICLKMATCENVRFWSNTVVRCKQEVVTDSATCRDIQLTAGADGGSGRDQGAGKGGRRQ